MIGESILKTIYYLKFEGSVLLDSVAESGGLRRALRDEGQPG